MTTELPLLGSPKPNSAPCVPSDLDRLRSAEPCSGEVRLRQSARLRQSSCGAHDELTFAVLPTACAQASGVA